MGLLSRGTIRVTPLVGELRIELVILNDRIARSVNLQPRDLDILDVIDREGPCTPSQIADRIGWSRATMTGVLARLETDTWIERRINPADARSMTIASTGRFEELRSAYSAVDETVADNDSAELAGLILDTAKQLRSANRSARRH